MSVRIANAPVSFGIFELAGPEAQNADPEAFLETLAGIGYTGVDLGPVGWLGRGARLRDRLVGAGLGLAGGWVDLRFFDDSGYAEDLARLDEALDVFEAALPDDPRWAPKPTLAVTDTAERAAHPGGGATMPEIQLDADGWRTLARNVADAAERCRARGLEPTFHHHVGTFVESPDEIERFLESTDVSLTLDTGHLILGGGDPVQALADWGGRINHVHVKDAHLPLVEEALRQQVDMVELWRRKVFCPLGEGNLDVDGFVAGLLVTGYSGWVVVEQDVLPGKDDTFAAMVHDQEHNLQYLHQLGLAPSGSSMGPEA